MTFRPLKIISGGQTGVDRAALDAAIELGIAHGGWCPRGRLAEDGRIPNRYCLTESASPEYPVRTEQNVVDSDATLILCRGRPSGGTELTLRLAQQHARPCLVLDLDQSPQPDDLLHWIEDHAVETLNVAGPRQSQCPAVATQAWKFLVRALGPST